MTVSAPTASADLVERMLDLLAEAEAVTSKEIREASRNFTTAPSGKYIGGISRGGQQIKILALRRQAEVERIALQHNRQFPDASTEEQVQRLMTESDLLETLFNFEITDRFVVTEPMTYEIGRGFELWGRPDDAEPSDDEEDLDDLEIPSFQYRK